MNTVSLCNLSVLIRRINWTFVPALANPNYSSFNKIAKEKQIIALEPRDIRVHVAYNFNMAKQLRSASNSVEKRRAHVTEGQCESPERQPLW